MKFLTITIMSIVILAVLAQINNQDIQINEQTQFDNKNQHEQAQADAYYEGDFDSYRPEAWEQASLNGSFVRNEDLQQQGEEEEQDMLQFAEHMGDFVPDETFTFKLKADSEETFFLWPYEQVENVRGLFHSEMDQDQHQDYVSLDVYQDDILIRHFNKQRLGVLHFSHQKKHSKYKFKFTSGVVDIRVYVSYQYVTRAKLSEKTSNISSVQQAADRFMKVNKLALAQETQMSRIISISRKHQERIDKYLRQLQYGILLQTIVIVGGSCYTLSLLRKQLYAGYELLV